MQLPKGGRSKNCMRYVIDAADWKAPSIWRRSPSGEGSVRRVTCTNWRWYFLRGRRDLIASRPSRSSFVVPRRQLPRRWRKIIIRRRKQRRQTVMWRSVVRVRTSNCAADAGGRNLNCSQSRAVPNPGTAGSFPNRERTHPLNPWTPHSGFSPNLRDLLKIERRLWLYEPWFETALSQSRVFPKFLCHLFVSSSERIPEKWVPQVRINASRIQFLAGTLWCSTINPFPEGKNRSEGLQILGVVQKVTPRINWLSSGYYGFRPTSRCGFRLGGVFIPPPPFKFFHPSVFLVRHHYIHMGKYTTWLMLLA